MPRVFNRITPTIIIIIPIIPYKLGIWLYLNTPNKVTAVIVKPPYVAYVKPTGITFIAFAIQNIAMIIVITQKIVGIILQDKGVLRSSYEITHEQGKGVVLSGSYSPTLQSSIGLARIDPGYQENGKVIIRNKLLNIDFVSPRFLGQGKI